MNVRKKIAFPMYPSPLRNPANADNEIGGRRKDQSGSHETFDIAVIGKESIDEFSYGVNEQHCRADHTQLGGVECTVVENGFFDHIERGPADIVKTVTQQCRDEHL